MLTIQEFNSIEAFVPTKCTLYHHLVKYALIYGISKYMIRHGGGHFEFSTFIKKNSRIAVSHSIRYNFVGPNHEQSHA